MFPDQKFSTVINDIKSQVSAIPRPLLIVIIVNYGLKRLITSPVNIWTSVNRSFSRPNVKNRCVCLNIASRQWQRQGQVITHRSICGIQLTYMREPSALWYMWVLRWEVPCIFHIFTNFSVKMGIFIIKLFDETCTCIKVCFVVNRSIVPISSGLLY